MITESLIDSIKRGRTGKAHGYSIGLPKLEEIIDGVTKGTYTLIFAESGVGKSSFMLYSYIYKPLMEHLDDNKFRMSVFSLEMNADMLMAKLLTTYIFEKYNVRLSIKQLLSIQKNFILSDDNFDIVQECIPWMKKVEKIMTVYDKSSNANSIYSNILKELEKRGHFEETENRKIYYPDDPDLIHVVIIDHLARVSPQKGNTLKEEMDQTSKYLYSLKNRCGISPVVIMQSNRNIQSMERRAQNMVIPLTSDLKDSNSPLEDSEICLAIFSPHRAKLKTHCKYDISQLEDKFRSIFVLKSRYGISDYEDCLYYDGKCNIWKELMKPDEIYDYEMFNNPRWYLEDRHVEKKIDEEVQSKPKFIL